MEHEVLVALLIKKVEDRLASLPESSPLRGPRGQRGATGRDGKDFDFSEHAETIRAWAKEFALKFEDLDADQLSRIRGPSGRDGVDGRNFDFSEHRDEIENLCRGAVDSISDSLKLKFSDLTEEEISQLRGPRGRDGVDGKEGKGFEFEEHRAFFEGLKPKFSDFTAEEVDQLRLRFADLTEEEKSTLKLRFTDLTDDERHSLKGARGARGQRGKDGADGKDGKDGRPGEHGRHGKSIMGPRGVDGRDGQDGRDGRDAPHIVDIRVERGQKFDEIEFVFEFSDGTTTTSNAVKLPQSSNVYISAGGVASAGGGGGGAGEDGASAYEIAVENGFVGTEEEWLESLVGPQGEPGLPGGAESFDSIIAADETVSVDIVDMDDFGAIEYSVAMLMGTSRSFLKLVVQKSEGDLIDDILDWDDIPDMDGPGGTVETMWESAVAFDLDIEANVLVDGMNLIFKNNEASTIKVSGTRNRIPDFI